MLAACALVFIPAACAIADAESTFTARVQHALGSSVSQRVRAGTLTDFPWDTLCFERGDTLLLKFGKGRSQRVFSFDYTDYFVDEAYVAESLAERCVGRDDEIVLRRKYPGHARTVEFQRVGAPGTPR